MSYYALTDVDWPWDDRDEGRAIVVYASSPEDAVVEATRIHREDEEIDYEGGVTWKVARLDDLGFQGVEWTKTEITYDPFVPYDVDAASPILSKSDFDTVMNLLTDETTARRSTYRFYLTPVREDDLTYRIFYQGMSTAMDQPITVALPHRALVQVTSNPLEEEELALLVHPDTKTVTLLGMTTARLVNQSFNVPTAGRTKTVTIGPSNRLERGDLRLTPNGLILVWNGETWVRSSLPMPPPTQQD